jgi:Holliday junction DNA helicase RuvA
MITRLRGELLEMEADRVVVEAAGVGYEVFMPSSLVMQLPSLGNPVDLYIRQIFREDAVVLYGFLEPLERHLFDLLKEVKGCGPKMSMALLDVLGTEGVIRGLAQQDQKLLMRASGVGARLAERLIVELKDKIQQEMLLAKASTSKSSVSPTRKTTNELVEALLALGYRRYDAELAADSARQQAETLEEQLKIALRSLQR